MPAKRFYLIALLGSVLSLPVIAQSKTQRIDSLLQYAADNGLFNGVIAVVDKDQVIYNKGFGYADQADRVKNDEHTLFNLCSISKQFTAMGIMMLKEQGKLSYDDKLVSYFPELPYPDITLRQLLTHSSGLPDYFGLVGRQWMSAATPTNADIIAFFAEHKPAVLFAPGERYQYCNTGYVLLASLIEKLSGLSYADFLHKNIFEKVGMSQTLVYQPYKDKDKQVELPGQLAQPYAYDYAKSAFVLTRDFDAYRRQVTLFDGTYGDGGVYSCSEDMLQWDQALKTDKLVHQATLDEAFTSGIAVSAKSDAPMGYGFGWFVVDNPQYGKVVQHTGGWPGFRQAFVRYLDKDRTLLVLRNNEINFASIQSAVDSILDDKPYTLPKGSLAYRLSLTARQADSTTIRKKYEEIKNTCIANEDEMNLAGYGLMVQNKNEAALVLMQINAELYPNSWNVYDSLGELYLKMGDKIKAKQNYEKSVQLNPHNESGKKAALSL